MKTRTYTHADRNLVCRCGVALEQHTATAPHTIDYQIKGMPHQCNGFEPASKQNRNRTTGQYTYEGQWDRLCVCGQPLGMHGAEAPHTGNKMVNGVLTETDCQRFRPSRRTKKIMAVLITAAIEVHCPYCQTPQPSPGNGSHIWTVAEVERESTYVARCDTCKGKFFIPSKV